MAAKVSAWDSGLFDCCAEPGGKRLFLKTLCVPCLTLGEINDAVAGPGGYPGGCLAMCFGYMFGPVCCCPMLYMEFIGRSRTAQMHGIQESKMSTAAACCCCSPCSMIQIANQHRASVEARKLRK